MITITVSWIVKMQDNEFDEFQKILKLFDGQYARSLNDGEAAIFEFKCQDDVDGFKQEIYRKSELRKNCIID